MLNFKFVLAFIFFTKISCDYVIDHVFKNMLNSTVDRCDNFYRHVCGVSTRFGMERLSEKIIKNNFIVSDDVSEYLMELIKCSGTNYTKGTVSNKLKNLLEDAIQNGVEEQFLKNMTTIRNVRNFTGDNNHFLSFLENWESDLDANYTIGCKYVIGANEERLWLYKYKHVNNEFQTIFDEIKIIFNTWIEETPSFKKYNIINKYHEIMNTMRFNNMSSSERISKLTVEYKNCQNSLGEWLDDQTLVNIFCIHNNYQRYESNSEYLETDYNGYYSFSENKVIIGFPYYAIASRITSKPFLIGSLGSIIGHEISHAIIRPYNFASQRTINCIQNQFYKTCDYFNVPSDNCIQYTKRIGDNGSDLLGFRGVIQYAKNHFGAKLNEQNDEYTAYTNLQLVFMGQASIFCNWRKSNFAHSPGPIRSNAMAAQNSEFLSAFECGPDSKMAKSSHKKCYILGPDASSE
ncbi:unnamed protein product [Caenorhabditis angaria]|uniref:Peptidase M13 C-terminal domain-containing protein n=1 Tax=Caenorhabditis angaria TaxID=860376 RepID=A0A9P1J660_9PELO|nr:unnamed protein product [Caenorhabditis angaria]